MFAARLPEELRQVAKLLRQAAVFHVSVARSKTTDLGDTWRLASKHTFDLASPIGLDLRSRPIVKGEGVLFDNPADHFDLYHEIKASSATGSPGRPVQPTLFFPLQTIRGCAAAPVGEATYPSFATDRIGAQLRKKWSN